MDTVTALLYALLIFAIVFLVLGALSLITSFLMFISDKVMQRREKSK